MTDVLRLLTPGPCTTVQDLGRFHAYHLGVPVSGVMDDYAAIFANRLVGNEDGAALLEMTLVGAILEVLAPCDIAITGAAMGPRVGGVPVRQWTSLRVAPGDLLELGGTNNGCRAYLAVGGGIDVAPLLGSRSTYLGGGCGGYQGRMLAAGDVLQRRPTPLLTRANQLPWHPLYPETITIRAIPGPHQHWFTKSLEPFYSASFTVSAQCNRMGIRLDGAKIDRDPGAPESILSEPVVPGNIQIPAGGQPIILLKEQTIGGYTAIATVISCDLWRLGQAKPGDCLRFVCVDLETAHSLLREWKSFTGSSFTGSSLNF
jgi:biotin-dependent carboxylase-like uncharacterized protein